MYILFFRCTGCYTVSEV